MKVILAAFFTIYSQFLLANICTYDLIELPLNTLIDISEKINVNDHIQHVNNPLVASVLWYKAENEYIKPKLMEVILKSRLSYKPAAKIVLYESLAGRLETKDKRARYLKELYDTWPFAKIALTISTMKNNREESFLHHANELFTQQLMKPDPLSLYYLSVINRKLGHDDLADSYIFSAIEYGSLDGFTELVEIHKNIDSCKQRYLIYKELFHVYLKP